MNAQRDIIEINEELCDGCGQCVNSCAEGALAIVDGKAKLVSDIYCDGLGACLGTCPRGALKIIRRNADNFDEEAVMKKMAEENKSTSAPSSCGCPGMKVINLKPLEKLDEQALVSQNKEEKASNLGNWPVKIRLMPEDSPLLEGADILIVADCAPIALANFNERFLAGRIVLAGCPKFENRKEWVDKLTRIFSRRSPKSISVLSMEVPCCRGLMASIQQALIDSGAKIPLKEIIVKRNGQILTEKQILPET